MADPFIGEIKMFAGNFAPSGYEFCNGQLLSIQANQALFSVLGTIFGGDGTTNFALPDMRSRVPIHMGQGNGLSNYKEGETTGSESVTLTVANLPAHRHSLSANTAGNHTSPSGNFPGNEDAPIKIYATSANATMNAGAIGSTGDSQPAPVIQPVLCVNFIIAVAGVFPSRS